MTREHLLSFALVLLTAVASGGCGLLRARPKDSPVPTAMSPLSTLSPLPSPPPTITPTASSTIQPTSTPIPSPSPTRMPTPTLVPTIDPAMLPDRLGTAFTVQQMDGADGHTLRRVTGWEYGPRTSHYNYPSYRWLDSAHLLLFPLVGEDYDEMTGGGWERTLPIVVNLNDGESWLPALDRDSYPNPLWSDALQVLIVAQGKEEIVLLDVNGRITRRYTGQNYPLYLSPSGKRLLAGFIWRDLETGQTVDFSGQHKWTMTNPDWSSDETRLFDFNFFYADANTGEYGYVGFVGFGPVGRSGPFGDNITGFTRGRWVLDDTRGMIEWDVADTENKIMISLIDPQARTYEDLCDVAGLAGTPACTIGVLPNVAPNGEHVRVDRYIVDLRTFVTQTLPSDFGFTNWSPDGQFALLSGNWDQERELADYQLLSLINGNLYPVAGTHVAAPTWNPQSEYLAFLAEDKRTLTVLDVETWTTYRVSLSQPATNIFWRSQGDGLALLAKNGSLWWVPNLTAATAESLTPPLPEVRDVHWPPSIYLSSDIRWSPDGEYVAFVSGPDVYVVSIKENW